MHFNIMKYGAVAGGKTLNTQAIANAIEACSKAGGGTVIVPPGTFLTGPIELRSNMVLHVAAGATILFHHDMATHPLVESRWAGTELHMYSPLVFGKALENVAVTGRGVFDGNPQVWWDYFTACNKAGDREPICERGRELAGLNKGRYEDTDCGGSGLQSQCLRPPLMELNNCRNVRLDGFTNQNSPFWNTHLLYCEDVTVHDVTFRNPIGAPNGDGLDLDSCNGVRVSNCHFDVNDDCLCLKSGMNDDGHRVGKPSENITITNCTMLRGHGGVVFGSDGAGGIRNVVVSNCIFNGTDRGIRLKANRGRYSVYEDLRFDNIIMKNVRCPFVMNLFYTCGSTEATHDIISDPNARPVTESTPAIRNIHISNITARGRMACGGVIVGLPERPVADVTLDNVEIYVDGLDSPVSGAMAFNVPPMSGQGLYVRHASGLAIRNSRFSIAHGPAMTFEESGEVELRNVRLDAREDGAEDIVANNSTIIR